MMADSRTITPAGARNMRRHLRTSSQSPTRPRRIGDDLLTRLTPATAVDAFRAPTGALKRCLDQATVIEKTFAMRTAIASQKINDWVEELSRWSWPAEGGSAGFVPPAKKRRGFETEIQASTRKGEPTKASSQPDTRYYGSLLAEEIAQYETRIDEIQEEMDALDLEELKSQVLHNHILPLSRPGTPFSDAGLSVASALSYTKMEDLTAVVTALIMQTLPKLSRLSRLLYTWTIRPSLLRKVPMFLTMLTDAEVALQSGWKILSRTDDGSPVLKGRGQDHDGTTPNVTREEFNVMKLVLQDKISPPGREIDSMLDALEGMQDTLPNEWLERLEVIEGDYAKWEIAAEQQVREGEWAKTRGSKKPRRLAAQPKAPRPDIHIQEPSPARETFDDDVFTSPPTRHRGAKHDAFAEQDDDGSEYGGVRIRIDEPRGHVERPKSRVDYTELMVHQRDLDSEDDPSVDYIDSHGRRLRRTIEGSDDSAASDSERSGPSSRRSSTRSYDGNGDGEAHSNAKGKAVLSELDRNVVRAGLAKHESSVLLDSPILEASDEEDEESILPPMALSARRGSDISMASTVLHGSTSHFFDQVDETEDLADLELPRLPDPDEPFSSDALSPPSSPPLRYKPRATSVTFKEYPDVSPAGLGGGTPPRSPLQPPVVFDPDVSFELESQHGSPTRRSTTSEDDHLQRQIGAILESIPMKIRLNSKAAAINLNPPDFQPPTRPRPRTSDTNRRSASSLSSRGATPSTFSRSGTPSYMLAPARNTGPRSKSSQEIKVYHLMRAGSDAPIKLFIRTVGERNERVMVRVGGGWSDLGEYLREYALHHGRRSRGEGKVEVTDIPAGTPEHHQGSSPGARPASAMERPITPLRIRKTRKSLGEESLPRPRPKTPHTLSNKETDETPNSETSFRSRASSKAEWDEESSSLGLAGPKPKKVEMSEENLAWIESVKEKVRLASGEQRPAAPDARLDSKFGEMGKAGATKRVYRKN